MRERGRVKEGERKGEGEINEGERESERGRGRES